MAHRLQSPKFLGEEGVMSCIVLAIFLSLIAVCALRSARRWRLPLGHAHGKAGEPSRTVQGFRPMLIPSTDDFLHDQLWNLHLPALEFLNSARCGGAPVGQVTRFYRELVRAYPGLCDGSNFRDWLEVLQSAGVAVYCRAGAVIAITAKGCALLESQLRKKRSRQLPNGGAVWAR